MKALLKLWAKVHLLCTISIWTIATLCISFVQWDWCNPFQWLIDIPTYTDTIRKHILMGIFLYEFVVAVTTGMVNDNKKAK
jgi:hypothetical protein